MIAHHGKFAKTLPVMLRVAVIFVIVVAAAAISTWFWLMPANGADRIVRGTRVGGIDVGGMTRDDAASAVRASAESLRLHYALNGTSAAINPNDESNGAVIATYDAQAAADAAFAVGRTGSPARRLGSAISAAAGRVNLVPPHHLDRVALRVEIERVFKDDIILARNATIAVTSPQRGTPKATVVEGAPGISVDFDAVMRETERRLAAFSRQPVRLPITNGEPELSAEDVAPLLSAATAAVGRAPLTITAKDQGWTLSPATIADWITVLPVNGSPVLSLDPVKSHAYLASRAKAVATAPKDAQFQEKEGKVVVFVPSVNGVTLDIEASQALIAEAVFGAPVAEGEERRSTITLPLMEVEPEITTEKSNPYGIKEIVGVGASNFRGSPVNRRHNIAVGAKSVHGTLIPAGEEFSMLKVLGTIDGTTGYRQELVIKGNETKPEYGGGLCQIGSTAFRGALDSGLDITERRNHSYRVPYYERDGDGDYIGPGKDATIYDPAPDFRFKNDTANALLITTKITGDKLEFFFWGARDGRKSEQTDAKVFNIVPPPEKKVIETDTLPPGEEKCTEKPHVGSDAVFTYTVTYADGTKKERDFFSRYRPWQEVCLVGKDPNAPPVAPDAVTQDGSTPTLDAAGAAGN